MELRQAVETLQKFKNVLGSVEALERALQVAAALEQHVAAHTARRDQLVGELAALEAAIDEGSTKLHEIKVSATVAEREVNEFREVATRRVQDEVAEVRKAEFSKLDYEIAARQTAHDGLLEACALLKKEKASLAEAVSTLDAKLRDLKAAAASV